MVQLEVMAPAKKKAKAQASEQRKTKEDHPSDDAVMELLSGQTSYLALQLKDTNSNPKGHKSPGGGQEKCTMNTSDPMAAKDLAGACSADRTSPRDVWTSSRIKSCPDKAIHIMMDNGKQDRFMSVMLAIRDGAQNSGPPSVILASSADCQQWRKAARRLAPNLPVTYVNTPGDLGGVGPNYRAYEKGSIVIMCFDAFRAQTMLLDKWHEKLAKFEKYADMGVSAPWPGPKPVCLAGDLVCTCSSCPRFSYVVIDHRCAARDSQEDIEWWTQNCAKQIKVCRP